MDADKQYIPGLDMRRMRLAHAYVPFQHYSEHYRPEQALMRGTLFPELWMPYRPGYRGYY
ncbi:spore coat associated protein CotJA [Iocasia frigidifontis]|uniref:Spore coat associated protein CotJA n=1 Tax=Iocasia fonsfrigidae TaxID=2682810 RepID=A0A8A7K7D4_9FIRM|nr:MULTISPECIES: spore coat associated protein CotJA [Halanaerobiaceae]AZO94175.1 spore coat associated protein CotJA [Halocella sp. SP3-1]QTL97090.1 spore coat associated protein CotJA [Iocasia fonsfrigidae]